MHNHEIESIREDMTAIEKAMADLHALLAESPYLEPTVRNILQDLAEKVAALQYRLEHKI